MERKLWGQIGLEHPVGCCGGRIDTGGGQSGVFAVSPRRAAWWAVDAEPPWRIFRIVKVEEDVFGLAEIGFGDHGQ